MKPVVFLIGFLCATLLAACLWGVQHWTFAKTLIGGDYLLMGPAQAKECEEGGGCTIFSTREFGAAIDELMRRAQRHKGDGV